MSTSNPINSYSFFLNSTANNFTDGSSWTIPLPTNISVSNPANNFAAYITEASIPQTPFIISDQIGNNVFEFKLQVYVDRIINPNTGQIISQIDKWMDCTEVQTQYLNSLNLGAGIWVQAFATNPNRVNFSYTGPSNWCDFEANKVSVANGNYTSNAALLSAISTAMTTTMNVLTDRMKAITHYYSPQLIASFTNNITLSGVDKSDLIISMSNLWGVTATIRNFQIEFKRYRLYVKGNEIFSMIGFTDRDITFDFSDCTPAYLTPGAPLYTAALSPVSYISPNIMNLNPNVNYYIAILNLSQTKSFVAVNGSAVTSQTFSSLFRSSSLPRSEIYYSLPTVIQIQDKNFNFLELCIKDYRNRTIPTVLFTSPVFVTIVFQEILGNQSTPAINLQQLSDIDAVFWRQKELELQFELESFIRTKRLE
jgi:hypothetical protein